MIPHRAPFILPLLYPSLEWRVATDEKELYLTFDDGPVSGPTDFVLEVLARQGVQATFFCIGDNVRKHPAIFGRVIAHGHTVGNHTMNHLNGWSNRTDAYLENTLAFDPVATAAGLEKRTNLFRPPYGRITRAQIRALSDYRIIMWDVLSRDYNDRLPADRCLRNTIRVCRPGSIVVFHDSQKAWKNLEYSLPRVLDHFGGMGYRFRSM